MHYDRHRDGLRMAVKTSHFLPSYKHKYLSGLSVSVGLVQQASSFYLCVHIKSHSILKLSGPILVCWLP